MESNELTRLAETYTHLKKTIVRVSVVSAMNNRLDAPTFLARDSVAGLMLGSCASQRLAEIADVFTVYIQSPVLAYVTPFAKSRPYMTTSELGEYCDGFVTHVSLIADPRLIAWEIKEGNIVVSRSGRVGEAYWVDKRRDGVLVGDSFRVIAKRPEDRFFLYAILMSKMAREFLSGSAYGSVVDHASLNQLRSFPIPNLIAVTRDKLAKNIQEALAYKEQAYELMDEADNELHRVNRLPRLEELAVTKEDDLDLPYMIVRSQQVIESENSQSEFRLEAHFYNATALTAIHKLKTSSSKLGRVADIATEIRMSPLFVRNYVQEDCGVPYIAGKQISQIRPDFKFISKTETEDLDVHILRRGWTLITCAGSVGKVGYVSALLDGTAAQDLMRVIPDKDKIHPGYLNAWLRSAYGHALLIRCKYGSVVDRISPEQVGNVLIPLPSSKYQEAIGQKVEEAYDLREKSFRLEDEAQAILMREIQGQGLKES